MVEITYIEPPDGPMKVGEYDNGKAQFIYGAWRVDLGDFVYLSPNKYPVPIDDEEYMEVLVQTAERARDWRYIEDQFDA